MSAMGGLSFGSADLATGLPVRADGRALPDGDRRAGLYHAAPGLLAPSPACCSGKLRPQPYAAGVYRRESEYVPLSAGEIAPDEMAAKRMCGRRPNHLSG